MSQQLEHVFVVLSDLHFGNDLFESPTTPLLNVPIATYGLSGQKITKFFEDRCRGHSVACVRKLPRYLRMLLWQLRQDGYPESKFDLFILLGDQSTLAHANSYKFLREYIHQTEYETKDADGTFTCAGLGVAASDIIAIPGNHDKILRSSLTLYNNEFTRVLGLPEEVQPQRCTIAVRRFGEHEFVFILIEPSTYSDEDLKLGTDFRSHLAAGKVSEKLIEDVQTKLGILRDRGQLSADIKLQNSFSSAVKILLVHYAVDDTKFKSTLEEFVLPHGCEGLANLVDLLKVEFQLSLVLHGHLHVPMLYNYNGVQVISATTASRVDDARKTGFFLLKVFKSGNMVAEHHLWTGVGYTLDPDASLTRDVGYFPSQAAPAA
jgi:predicted phosphodiesterase